MLACCPEKLFRNWSGASSLIPNLQAPSSPLSREKEGEHRWLESILFPVGRRKNPQFLFSRHHGLLDSIKPWTLGLVKRFSSPHQGVHFSHFCFWVFTTTPQKCLRSFPSQSLPHFHSRLYSLPSPSAYNYHLSILISFQAAYIVAPTFMILAPYILIS